MHIRYSLHGVPIILSSQDETFIKFFERFIKGWAVEPSTEMSEMDNSIVLSLNNGDGGKCRNKPGKSAPIFKYYNVTAYQGAEGLHLMDDRSSHIYVEPALKRAQGRIARRAMTYDGFTTLLVLTLSELLKQEGYFYLHSACLSDHRGRGWLICGWPGAGKTTLSMGFLKEGFSFLSDDAILVRQISKKSTGISRGIPITESLSLRKVFRVGGNNGRKRSWQVEARLHARYDKKCVPEVLIHAAISGKKGTRLLYLSPSQSFLKLIPQSFQILGSAHHQTESHADVLKGLVHQCVSFDLRAGSDLLRSPEKLVRMVRERMKG